MAGAAVYSLLGGASIVFLVLLGNLSNGILCVLPSRAYSMIFAVVTFIILIIVPSLKKGPILAVLAMGSMLSGVLIITGLSAYFISTRSCLDSPVCETDVALGSIGSGFSAFTFT